MSFLMNLKYYSNIKKGTQKNGIGTVWKTIKSKFNASYEEYCSDLY